MCDKTELQTEASATEGLSSTEGASLSDLLCLHIKARSKELEKLQDIRSKIEEDKTHRLHTTRMWLDDIAECKAKLLALEVLQNGIHPESSEFE